MAVRRTRLFRAPRAPRDTQSGRTQTYIEGLGEVKEMLQDLRDLVPELYWEILEEYGDKINKGIERRLTPRIKTGALIKSVKVRKTYTERTQRVAIVAGGNPAPHAHLVEFGHRTVTKSGEVVGSVPGVHFMRDAFEDELPKLTKDLEDALKALSD